MIILNKIIHVDESSDSNCEQAVSGCVFYELDKEIDVDEIKKKLNSNLKRAKSHGEDP